MLGLIVVLAATFVGCHSSKISVDVNVGLSSSGAIAQESLTPYSNSRILGGDPVDPHSMPWQAALVWTNTYILKCGSVIICANFVMSAAHCNYYYETGRPINMTKEIEILIGEHDLQNPSSTRHSIKAVHEHPKYRLTMNTEGYYDFTIYELGEPIEFRLEAQALYLAYRKGQYLHVGTMMVVSGWGQTTYQGNVSHQLRAVKVPLVSDSDCERIYGGSLKTLFCVGYLIEGGKGSCHGDSGGPLAWLDPKTDKVMLQGLVAFGIKCGLPDKPAVYAKITSVLEWIKKETGDCNKDTCHHGHCMTGGKLKDQTREKYFN